MLGKYIKGFPLVEPIHLIAGQIDIFPKIKECKCFEENRMLKRFTQEDGQERHVLPEVCHCSKAAVTLHDQACWGDALT